MHRIATKQLMWSTHLIQYEVPKEILFGLGAVDRIVWKNRSQFLFKGIILTIPHPVLIVPSILKILMKVIKIENIFMVMILIRKVLAKLQTSERMRVHKAKLLNSGIICLTWKLKNASTNKLRSFKELKQKNSRAACRNKPTQKWKKFFLK